MVEAWVDRELLRFVKCMGRWFDADGFVTEFVYWYSDGVVLQVKCVVLV